MNEGAFWLAVAAVFIGGVWWYNQEEQNVITDTVAAPVAAPVRPLADLPVAFLDDGTVWRVDSSSVKGPRDKRMGWVVQDHSKNSEVAARETYAMWRVNCDEGSYAKLSVADYNAKGETLRSLDTPDAAIRFAVPGSNADSVMNVLCMAGFDNPPE